MHVCTTRVTTLWCYATKRAVGAKAPHCGKPWTILLSSVRLVAMRYRSHAFLGTPIYDLACTVTPCPNAIPLASCESCTYTNSSQQHSHMNLFQQNYWKLSAARYWRVIKQCSSYDDYIWIIGHLQLIILDIHMYIRICCPHKIRSTQHRFPSMGTF